MQESEQAKKNVPTFLKSLEWIALVLILTMIGGGIYSIINNMRAW